MNKKYIPLFVFTFLAFWLKTIYPLDPDYGWLLRTGQYLLSRGIPQTDPFSYTMPSYPWITHEWLSSVLFYLVSSIGGIIGLGFVLTFMFSTIFLIFLKKYNFRKESMLILVLGFVTFFPGWSIRAQVFSWFFYGLIVHLTFDPKQWQKYRYWVPFIFLLWVNLHGAFALGLITLALFLVFQYFQKKLTKTDPLIYIVSFLATLINPYGFRIYTEVFNTISNSSLHSHIGEWSPAIYGADLNYLLFLVLSCSFIWKYKKNFNLYQLGLFAGLLIFGFSSIKQIPYWLLTAMPLTTESFIFFYKDIKVNKLNIQRFQKAGYGLVILTLCLLCVTCYVLTRSLILTHTFYYPDKAVAFLKANPSRGELFAAFGWGGFLDWKYPEKKVFVDGRMPIWYWQAPKGELNSAFTTFLAITTTSLEIEPTFSQFNVDTVLYPNMKNELFYKKMEKQKDWKKIYEDDAAVIFRKY